MSVAEYAVNGPVRSYLLKTAECTGRAETFRESEVFSPVWSSLVSAFKALVWSCASLSSSAWGCPKLGQDIWT